MQGEQVSEVLPRACAPNHANSNSPAHQNTHQNLINDIAVSVPGFTDPPLSDDQCHEYDRPVAS